jgi:uncharacterized membrane protein YkgB
VKRSFPSVNLSVSVSVSKKKGTVVSEREIAKRLESIGVAISRYGLVIVLTLIGLLKFTAAEAAGIQPLVAHSPFMSWMYAVLSLQGVSNVVGLIEIATALLMASRRISPKASFVGSFRSDRHILADDQLSVFDTWCAEIREWHFNSGDAGQFLIKDLVLLGASFWTAAEALDAIGEKSSRRSNPC